MNDAPAQKHADVGMAMMGSNRCCHGSRGHRPHGCDGLGTIIYGIIIEIFSRMSNFIRYGANIFLFTFKLLMRYFYPDFFVYILNDRQSLWPLLHCCLCFPSVLFLTGRHRGRMAPVLSHAGVNAHARHAIERLNSHCYYLRLCRAFDDPQ